MTDLLQARSAYAPRARLGEGPVWDQGSGTLFWVDILNRRVHQFVPETGADRFWDVGDVVGCAVPAGEHTLLLALRHGLARLDLRSGGVEPVVKVEADKPRNRLNDGKCDSRGRLWIGSMRADVTRHGSLYRYDPDGTLHLMETGLGISNGLGWSPDDRTFYLTDSPAKQIYAYRFDAETGAIHDRLLLVDLAGQDASPDGLAVDSEGCIWSAQWGGGCVIRFAPDGRELARIEVPAKCPTSCAFGGPDLKSLYITSASAGLSQEELDEHFESGNVFCVQTAVAGLPSFRFGGEKGDN